MGIEWIGFDFDWTLYERNPAFNERLRRESYAVGKKLYNLRKEEVDSERRKRTFKHDKIIAKAQIRMARTKCGVWPRAKGIPETLKVLSKEYDMYIITNAQLQYLRKAMEILKIEESYFHILVSRGDVYHTETCEHERNVVRRKPHPSPFRYAIRYGSVTADKHAFVGDDETNDVEPARKLGMKPIKIGSRTNYSDVPYVRHVVEIPAVIRNL